MDLLKEHNKNFRYYLQTSSVKNIIYISFEYFASGVSETETTDMENCFLVCNKETGDEIDESQTITKTVWRNDVTIDLFFTDVYEYIKSRINKNITKIKISNFNFTDNKIVFENRIFKAFSECCKDLEMDIKDSAFRVSSDDYGELGSFTWKSGTLLVEDSSVLNFNSIYIEQGIIDTHNKTSADSYVNLISNNKINVISLKVNSTVKLNMISSNKSPTGYENAKILISYLNIFGMETLENDKSKPRITCSGYKSILINLLEINDNVAYGIIFKCDKMASCTINEIRRNVDFIFEGSTILIGSVGIVNLHKLNYTFKKTASIQENTNLISFLKDDSGLQRKITLYDTTIVNNTNININIFKLRNVDIKSIYISDCTLNKNVNMFDMNDTVNIMKFYLVKCNIISESDIIFKRIAKLSIADNTTIKTDANLYLYPQILSLNDSEFRYNNLVINNSNEAITKVSFTNMYFNGKTFSIDNSQSESSMSLYDTESTFINNSITIKKFNSTFDKSILKVKTLNLYGDMINKLLSTYIEFKMNKNCIINSYSSINGSFVFMPDDTIEKDTFTLNIADDVQFASSEKLNIVSSGDSAPQIIVKANMPVVCELSGFNKNEYIHFAMNDSYDSKQQTSFINIAKDNTDTETENYPILLNDSEKICTLSKELNDYNSYTYNLKKK